MKKSFLFVPLLFISSILFGQIRPISDSSWKKVYRETPVKINNLIHTKLDVRPDFSKSYLHGKAWLTLKPHFYPTDSLTLDAKGLEFKKITILKSNQQVPL